MFESDCTQCTASDQCTGRCAPEKAAVSYSALQGTIEGLSLRVKELEHLLGKDVELGQMSPLEDVIEGRINERLRLLRLDRRIENLRDWVTDIEVRLMNLENRENPVSIPLVAEELRTAPDSALESILKAASGRRVTVMFDADVEW
jgi:hypothetical protein